MRLFSTHVDAAIEAASRLRRELVRMAQDRQKAGRTIDNVKEEVRLWCMVYCSEDIHNRTVRTPAYGPWKCV